MDEDDETSHGISQQLYFEYMVYGDGYNVSSLIRYSEVQELFDYPMYKT